MENVEDKSGFEWRKVGTSFNVGWLATKFWGALPPPDEEDIKTKVGEAAPSGGKAAPFLKVTDIGVKRIHAAEGGLGLPNSFLLWHWGMVVVFLVLFCLIFVASTPIPDADLFNIDMCRSSSSCSTFWLTVVQKLIILFNMWESLGLGVLHGPLHAKFAPPFTDWWYRMTPGTLKHNAPFMPCLSNKRNWIDVIVEAPLTWGFTIRCLVAPEVTPELMIPLTLCGIYEFIFDYGQHMHTYGTQNLHCFVAMCFPVEKGQIVGIQLFLTWFYVCSGWCKIGPWFKYLNVGNAMTAKWNARCPWAQAYRKAMFKNHEEEDYRLTGFAAILSVFMAMCEVLGPMLCLSNDKTVVYVGLVTIFFMHLYIISTLIIDVFTWNFADAIWYVILFGILRTGFDWAALEKMDWRLATWLAAHIAYSAYGHFVPSHVPYVVAHRHAAGNFSQGVLLVKKSAAGKLAKLKAHAGLPQQLPGWMGEWFAFQAVWAYFWNWNLPSKMLLPLVVHAMGDGAPSDGMFHSSGDYILLHSCLLYDALVAHVRFDGLSSLPLTRELAKICDFEEGECTLCWVGAFQSFPAALLGCRKASWKIVDAKTQVTKEGTYTVTMLEDPGYQKPSDCVRLLPAIADAGSGAGLGKPLLDKA